MPQGFSSNINWSNQRIEARRKKWKQKKKKEMIEKKIKYSWKAKLKKSN